MTIVPIQTSAGCFVASFSKRGLSRLRFPGDGEGSEARSESETDERTNRWVELTANALQRALAGKSPGRLPPLDLEAGTDFQRAVWSELRAIPVGSTVTYQELSRRIGREKAVRATGQACGANPVPVLVPCHRVLAAGGKLGGFSGGLDWKKRLLQSEKESDTSH